MKTRPAISARRRLAHSPTQDARDASQPAVTPVKALSSGASSRTGSDGSHDPERPAIPDTLPILPVRNTVIFPGMVVPLTVGRPSSRKLLEESLAQSKIIGVFTQKDAKQDEPAPEDLHRVGVAVSVLKLIRQNNEQAVIVVQALERIAVRKVLLTHPFIRAEVEVLASTLPRERDREFEASVRGLRESASNLFELIGEEAEPARLTTLNIDDAGLLADFLAGTLNLEIEQKLALLEELDVAKRLQAVHRSVTTQLEIARIQQKIQKDVSSSFGDQQRRAYLREQVKAIQKELGEGEEGVEQQIAELRKRLTEAKPPEAVMEQAERELRRLGHLHPASPEYSVIVSYVEALAELPWNKLTEDNLDLDRARKILDRDHFNLEKVKRRLIEYLAVRKLNPAGHGPILCFLGPPGVGKTSLGRSVAHAMGREFQRISLGGLSDDAEIMGHRRTYVGAMPGRILQAMKKAGKANPILMLDEVDKLSQSMRGDTAAALLEVLDPEQNNQFHDRYLDV
ncbi:MAG: LON peptidase substrate-binding domain-containing protein, partial [Verrucomicrobia bacterium]|nr:LON peptidase substrate-binding domain-containing protein [Verrucomicrobiota bacterium]